MKSSLWFALAVVFFPFVALAQVAAPAVAPSGSINWPDVVMTIVAAVLPLLIATLSWASKKLADLIGQKVKNEEVRGILVRLDEIVLNVVKELMQTTVDAAKAAAEKDPDQWKKVADAAGKAALDKIKSYLGPAGLKLLGAVLGITDDAKLDEYLKTKIEATVHTVKLQKDVASGTASAASALSAAFGVPEKK